MRFPNLNRLSSIDTNKVDKKQYAFKKLEVGEVLPSKYTWKIDDDKERKKLIKSVESLCRQSLEYKELIKLLKYDRGMNRCGVFKNINLLKEEFEKTKIEIHHIPFDLYSIVDIIITKRDKRGEFIDELLIANEVMMLHYKGVIGLYPLSTTIHELFHSGDIFIPLKYVAGDVDEFYNAYSSYMTDELKDKYKKNKEITDIVLSDKALLNREYIYYEIEGLFGVEQDDIVLI